MYLYIKFAIIDLKLYEVFHTEQRSAFINVSHISNDCQLVDRRFFNRSLPCQHFFSNLDLIAVSQYHVHVYFMNYIIHYAIYVLVPRDFYSKERPVVAFCNELCSS